MKLVTYECDGLTQHGVLKDGEIFRLGEGDLATTIQRGVVPILGEGSGTSLTTADVRILAPLQRPGKVLAVAANYQEHVTEGGGPVLDKSRLSPRLFLKPSTTVVGPNHPIVVPPETSSMDWEAELGVVIGRRGNNIASDDALDYVFGYVCANDVSARSLELGYERDADEPAVKFFDWLAGKWFDGFAPMGPWLVTRDEIPDPQNLRVQFDLNGQRFQDGTTADMIFSVRELVVFASRLMTIEPGDVILTGTPAGVGAASGRYLKPGDSMVVTIDGLGQLPNTVVKSMRS